MLSRHAEALFWLGRYLERASDITRMLDVAYNAQLERTGRSVGQVWHDLLRVLYVDDVFEARYDEVSAANINRFLVFDLDNPSSVARSVHEARTNVMNVRDVVPNELLESVNRLHTRLMDGSLVPYVDDPHVMYEAIGEQSRSISGAVNDAMARTDGFRYLTLGRLLERAEMTCRMIAVNRRSHDYAVWMGVLRSLSGYHAFTQSRSPLAQADDIVRWLLLEPTFPFGVLHCLQASRELAREVSGAGKWETPRVLGRLSAAIEFVDVPPLDSSDLEDLLETLEDGIRRASEALHRDLFQFGGDPSLYSFEAP
jgi:uncharacterized alpha-E superfamily protein